MDVIETRRCPPRRGVCGGVDDTRVGAPFADIFYELAGATIPAEGAEGDRVIENFGDCCFVLIQSTSAIKPRAERVFYMAPGWPSVEKDPT